MTGHVVHAGLWLVVLGAQWLYLRGRRRRQVAAWITRLARRRWHNAARTAAAIGRIATFHPRRPEHAKERHA